VTGSKRQERKNTGIRCHNQVILAIIAAYPNPAKHHDPRVKPIVPSVLGTTRGEGPGFADDDIPIPYRQSNHPPSPCRWAPVASREVLSMLTHINFGQPGQTEGVSPHITRVPSFTRDETGPPPTSPEPRRTIARRSIVAAAAAAVCVRVCATDTFTPLTQSHSALFGVYSQANFWCLAFSVPVSTTTKTAAKKRCIPSPVRPVFSPLFRS